LAMNNLSKIDLGFCTYYEASDAISRQYDEKKIIRVQNAKLQKLINYSISNIKYYQEMFQQAGIRLNDIKTVEDMVNIPLLTKDTLRERFWDLLPRRLPQCTVSRTSGSTGVPVCLLSDDNSRLFNSAAVIRYRKALNIPLIGTQILTPLKTENEPRKRSCWTFMQGVHRTSYVNPYSSSETEIEYAAHILKQLRTPAIIGITPAIRALAYRIRDGILPSIKPVAVLTTGEYLSIEVRQLLEETFDTKVTDIYACNEAGDIAWQCRQAHNYHINADNCVVEILNDNKPVASGEIGEVVITNLNRFSMPIIRYKNGDLARFAPKTCPCGCRLPVISEIIGRTGEDMFLPSGKVIPWNQLKGLMTHPQIRQFQLVQNDDGSITVRYVAEKETDIPHIENLLHHRFTVLTANTVNLFFERSYKIDPAPSGKSKLVISRYRPSDSR
jgi:phenylacetate-CoA ligase